MMTKPKNAGRREVRVGSALVLSGLCAAAAVACSGNKEPKNPLPSQTVTQVTPQLVEPPPPLPPPIREIQPTRPTVKVIDPGGDEDQPTTLLEASRLAKARKGQTKQSIAVINDENLHEYAKDAEVIVLDSPPAAPMPDLDPPATEEESEVRDEQYWRSHALELRMGWRRTIDHITELELESAALRQQFYAEDDPYLRDSQLKPAWDRVLDRLDQLRETASRYSQELDVFVSEGQRASVPQGWLNQGWELEPSAEERKSLEKFPTAEAIDPPVIDIEEEDS